MSGTADTVSLRVTLRYATVDEFIDRHCEHVSSAGLFVRTKAPKSPGTRIRFQLMLSDGQPALQGEGVVVSVRSDDRPGMALRFNELDDGSRSVVERLVERHGDGSLAPTPLSLRIGPPSTDLPSVGGSSTGSGSLGSTSLAPPFGGGLGEGPSRFGDLASSPSWASPSLPSLDEKGPDSTERIDLNRLRSELPMQPPPPKPGDGPALLPQEPMD
ncbi:MAG TPA: TIGR02266 family protein, partial [Myxococcales bacterium LLY-WYZ-16_1]|nr:TIGR02266 family protein [Myxococcales bacterium LLY-WYZ-16_1]